MKPGARSCDAVARLHQPSHMSEGGCADQFVLVPHVLPFSGNPTPAGSAPQLLLLAGVGNWGMTTFSTSGKHQRGRTRLISDVPRSLLHNHQQAEILLQEHQVVRGDRPGFLSFQPCMGTCIRARPSSPGTTFTKIFSLQRKSCATKKAGW